MAYLQYYRDERIIIEGYDESISEAQTILYFNRLKAHYKFRQSLDLSYKSTGGRASLWYIKLNRHRGRLGVLAHEVAHALQYKKDYYCYYKEKRYHTKKHLAIMKRVFAYIMAHRISWEEADKRKSKARMTAYQKSEERKRDMKELKKTDAYKVENFQKRLKRLETKRKRLETIIKKINKSLKYYDLKAFSKAL